MSDSLVADQGVVRRAKYILSDQKPLILDLMQWSDPSYLLSDLFDVDEDLLQLSKSF